MIKPIGDRVLVKPNQAEEKTKSGIYIPETAKVKPNKGIVIICGDGVFLQNGNLKPMQVRRGDEVYYQKGAGTSVDMDGVEHLILSEFEIFGKEL